MIDISKLTDEEKAQLAEQLQQEDTKKANKIREDREAYKDLTEKTVKEAFEKLENLSTMIK